MKKQFVGLLASSVAVLIVGCAGQKDPAQQAIATAQSGLSEIADEARKYAPDQYQAVQTQIATAQDEFNKGDYKDVLAAAPALTSAIASLKSATIEKSSEAAAAIEKAKGDWGPISAEIPRTVDAIQHRVAELSKSHHLPHGVTKEALESVKSGLDALKSGWNDATTAATSGDYTTAMSKAQEVKDKAAEIMKSLDMKSAS